MLFQKILLFMALDEVLSYHFYNPSTHDVLTKSSLNNIPSGYKLIPPPKSNRKRGKSQRGNRNGRCTDAGFTCNSPFDKSQTFQYECDDDNNCPRNYKCCAQKCFLHKICTKADSQTPPGGSNNKGSSPERPGKCEKWPYNCQNPYSYSLTSVFKCNYDRQCPKNFKCCQQSCFLHRICSRISTDVENILYDNRNKTVEKFVPSIDVIIEVATEASDEYLGKTETQENIKTTEYGLTSKYDDGYDEFKTNKNLTTEVTTEIEFTFENKTEGSSEPEYDYGDEDEDVDEDADDDGDAAYYEVSEEENDDNNKTLDTSTSSTVKELTEIENKIIDVNGGDNIPPIPTITLDIDENSNDIFSSSGPTTSPNLNTRKVEYKSYSDRQSSSGLFLTTTKYDYGEKRSTPSVKSPDPNAIIPEYADYYYYYD